MGNKNTVYLTQQGLEDLKKELETTKLEKESLKMTIDTLRKNGVID